jgi:hypothetical protein
MNCDDEDCEKTCCVETEPKFAISPVAFEENETSKMMEAVDIRFDEV